MKTHVANRWRRRPIAWAVPALALWLGATLSAQWGSGWQIPAGAEREVSPLKPSAEGLAKGRGLFDQHCVKCHGAKGLGDGPDSDPRNPAADLTDPFRADLNPDGVVFYRILNGKPPIMPAFKGQLDADQAWTLVAYVKSLRAKP